MKKGRILRQHWLTLLILVLFFFWLGYFITEYFVNLNYATYSVDVKSNVISKEEINVDFFLHALEKKDSEGKFTGQYSYSSVKPNDIFENDDISINENEGVLNISIKSKYFINVNANTISKETKERYEKVINKVILYYDANAFISEVKSNNYISGFYIGLFSLAAGFVVVFAIYFLYYKKHPNAVENIYDNENIFSTPFHKKYWKKAFDSVRKIKTFDMCLIALLFALQMVVKVFRVPSGFSNLGLGITFLVFATICLIYGPIWGLFIGFFSDVLGYVLFPTPAGGTFFIGYSIQAMLTGFVYGFFLYKTDITFSKTFLSRLIVNILLNGVMGAFLWGYISDFSLPATITYMITITMPKNIIYLFPQSVLLYGFLILVLPLFQKKNIVPKEIIEASIKKRKKSL